MMIIGCDFHTRYQQIATLNEAAGELLAAALLAGAAFEDFGGSSGRALSGYNLAKAAICAGEISTGCVSTYQVTPSVQGGLIR